MEGERVGEGVEVGVFGQFGAVLEGDGEFVLILFFYFFISNLVFLFIYFHIDCLLLD